MLDDLALFAAIVDSGSLSAAARRTRLPPATVTRRLQQLEQQLGCKLLHRSARRLQPTPEGLEYYERCAPLLRSLQQATESLEASHTQVQGLVRVLAPMNLAKGLLRPVWTAFLAQHPKVQLDLRLSNLREDVFEHGADLAVRLGDLPDSSLAHRRLGTTAIGLLASPGYLAQAGTPRHPRELAGHQWLVAEPLRTVQLQHAQTGERYAQSFHAEARCVINDVALAAEMACTGHGMLHCPLWMCDAQLRSGALLHVLPQWHAPANPIFMVWPQQRHMPARVRALVEMLGDFARAEPWLQGQMPIIPTHDD
ncbi:LysR family transcriptional regulator [Comamonas sp. JUb58]|uniref:LysR family transcriptional regulator n=1 Tax=Comamonas sp. JUb58 TaxID=2485114 RepID=UPI00105D224A|nr:LysR family transcriptional regulator [Comamonas sp. JUb58]TDS85181.1 LysR family transcriptional regulator [Comamonas sp. JUb58]